MSELTPSETVDRFFAALGNEQYLEACGLLAAGLLKRFRVDDARYLRPGPAPTVDDYLDRLPDVSRELAESWVAGAAKRPPTVWSDYFAGVESSEDLDVLSDVELYARHLEAIDHVARYRRMIDQLRSRHPEHEEALVELREREDFSWRFAIYGVSEQGERAYVLFGPVLAVDADLRYEPIPQVAVLRMTPEGWRLAEDPGIYQGGTTVGPIEVAGPDGEKVVLDPNVSA